MIGRNVLDQPKREVIIHQTGKAGEKFNIEDILSMHVLSISSREITVMIFGDT